MDGFLRYISLALVTALTGISVSAEPTPTNQPEGFRLTVELRDGSRVVGRSRDESFVFHSDVLGETKLPLKKIRSVEYEGAATNVAKLTTVSADMLKVEFAMKAIHMETAFGDVKLPVALIKSVKVSVLGKAGNFREGMLGLWSGEGNAVDSIAGNNGALQGVGFVPGVVGQAFSFDFNGGYTGVQIPDKPAYELTHALTIAGWVRPRGHSGVIFFRGDGRPGLDPYCVSIDDQHNLCFAICDQEGQTAIVQTRVELGSWIHLAAVLDGDSGNMTLYTNGVLAAELATTVRPFGPLLANASPGIGIGNVNDGSNNFPFGGDIDEVALYGRALTSGEVNASFAENEANAGERVNAFQPGRNSGYSPRRPFGVRN